MKNSLSQSLRKESNSQEYFKNLKKTLELEDLKTNLMKPVTTSNFYKKSCSVYLDDKGNTSNQDRSEMKILLRKMLTLKKENDQMSKQIYKKHLNLRNKEKIIFQLNEEMKHFQLRNEDMKYKLEDMNILREVCEKNRDGVIQYCKNLKHRYKSFMEIINKYESKIEVLHIERENIFKNFEIICEAKCKIYITLLVNEKNTLENDLEKTIKKIEFNMTSIQELRVRHENLMKEREDEQKYYDEKEKMDVKKFLDLERKYKELTVKSQEFNFIQTSRENEVRELHSRSMRDFKKKEDQNLYIFLI
jgi:hypothetical protein